ncbi:MAG: hypothetical protein HRT61_09380 [Ekhidna sp.]|nr:hypothetical protein [Ekhidna sp.]
MSDAAWLKKGLAYYFLFDIRKYLNDEENILIRLDGTNAFNNSSDTIAKLIRTNANLGSDNIIDYTHFAFFFNRNAIDNHEIFYIINRYDDPFLVRDKYYLKTLKNRIKPSFVTEERNGFFYIRINFLYQGKLHITTISVKKQTGYFGMQKEGKVIGGFSQRMYAPIN